MDQGQLFDDADAAMAAQHQDQLMVEYRAEQFFRDALARGCNPDDCHAAVWLTRLDWDRIAGPQERRAA